MQFNLEAGFACLPVTALHTLSLADRQLLLSGCGAVLKVYDEKASQLRISRRIFGDQAIHGITSDSAFELNKTVFFKLLIWGGSIFCTGHLKIADPSEETQNKDISLEISEPVDLGDWILHGRYYRSWLKAPYAAYVITSHNILYELPTSDEVTPEMAITPVKILSGPACVLYSANIRMISAGNVLVSAGTVFGEIVVWSARKPEDESTWSVKLHHVLLGHKGSVFGVSISEQVRFGDGYKRLLASCSDDRSIMVWDITENSEGDLLPDLVQLSDVTGFGEHDTTKESSLLAIAYGHWSRIWNVQFLDSYGPDYIDIISTGEDATFQQWRLSLKGLWVAGNQPVAKVQNLASDRHHFGKNIWSSAHTNHKSYTGGADGAIIARSHQGSRRKSLAIKIPFKDILDSCINHATLYEPGRKFSPGSLKQYVFLGECNILATTDSGLLLWGELNLDSQEISWKLYHKSRLKSPILLCIDQERQVAVFSEVDGSLFIAKGTFDQAVRSSVKLPANNNFMCIVSQALDVPSSNQQPCVLIPLPHEQKVLLFWLPVDNLATTGEIEIDIPPNFMPTSACYHAAFNVLVMGSRNGALAVFFAVLAPSNNDRVRVYPQIHSSDTVTSIQVLVQEEGFSKHALYLLTTGRDGTYAVHRISLHSPDSRSCGMLQTVHRSSPPFGPSIEGGYFIRSATEEKKQLVLYGFRAKDFVVWNETLKTEIISTDCGGSHRGWTYAPKKNEDSRISPNAGGCFIWTKAGSFNLYEKSSPDHYVIQKGGHGREINTLAVSEGILDGNIIDLDHLVRKKYFVATGSEDTTIRIFALQSNSEFLLESAEPNPNLVCRQVLNKHTTGINHLQFHRQYLFSSGGCEELFVWRLSGDLPVIGVGVVLESVLSKTEVDADARITSFVALEEGNDEFVDYAESVIKICAAYSNGKFKIFQYQPPTRNIEGGFELQKIVSQGSFCLTQIFLLSKVFPDNTMYRILTAGTNGALQFYSPRCLSLTRKIHQNSIKAFLTLNFSYNRHSRMILTGGDDNALGVTVLNGSALEATDHPEERDICTTLVSNAHAAAITAITAIATLGGNDGGPQIDIFATTGNDQMVKIWRATSLFHPHLDVQTREPQIEVIIGKIGELHTSVADAAAMTVLPQVPGMSEKEVHLLVVGVGMEVLKVKRESESEEEDGVWRVQGRA